VKTIQIVPQTRVKLYDDLVRTQAEIRKKGRGTFYRAGPASRSAAKWKHKAYAGSVNIKRGEAGAITAKIRTPPEREWQMLSAFLGFVDRHLRDRIASIAISYG
jgi:hypothetical protein